MDFMDTLKRFKRLFDTNYTIRKVFLIAVAVFILIWIFGLSHFPHSSRRISLEPAEICIQRKLSPYLQDADNMDAKIMYSANMPHVPYVGNGYVGATVKDGAPINIKSYRGRILNVPVPFRPLVQVSVLDEETRKEAFVSHYAKGHVNRLMCIDRNGGDTLEISSLFYAHRVNPSVLEQNISISNPSSRPAIVQFVQLGWSGDTPFKTEQKIMNFPDGEREINYVVGTGVVETKDKVTMAVAVAYKKVPNALTIPADQRSSIRLITVVQYAYLANRKDYDRVQAELVQKAEEDLRRAIRPIGQNYYEIHENAWSDLWGTGFSISPSRAENALNGDAINATMYYVLSQVRAPLHETGVSLAQRSEASSVLAYSEGCYGGHHTLQAPSLWSPLSLEEDVLGICNLWLLTLEKLGCHKLLKAGASGVIQAMVLSFGALKFRNFHLEFNTEPKDLHREYHFRRILYGNSTHVNISVAVGYDNKAVLYAALDRKDKDYYACDAGCLDAPLELGPQKQQFPVKLTDPVTSILYITSDRKHAEELHLSIHVKEILEAPAHEHHVISMHKHGSGYSAMSTMFWVGLSLLIILFHIFLFHLVYTEYFGPSQERFRSRKISDF